MGVFLSKYFFYFNRQILCLKKYIYGTYMYVGHISNLIGTYFKSSHAGLGLILKKG